MQNLLVNEAYRSGSDVTAVITNKELKAPDDGADATTPPGITSKQWLSDVETCWQFKAGTAGQPSKLKGEITKPTVAQILKSGGRFVLVASDAGDGNKGIEARRKVLVAAAKRARLPHSRIEVYSSEVLTHWINEHPALAAGLRGIPPGFLSLSVWADLAVHRDPWVRSVAIDEKLDQVRQAVEFDNPSPVVHHHIFGRPGIGKTRFVLQACREARWNKSVLYVPQWAEAEIGALLAAASQAAAARLVLVVDEVPPDRVKSLADAAFSAPERIRVITIGHHDSPDDNIPQIKVEALDDDTMAKLVRAAHPTMPQEHVDYVVSFADGFTRLARLAANAITTNAEMVTADLLYHGSIRQLMDSMLGNDDRQPLHVLAILSSVGWTGPRAVEGQAIAAHFNLDWTRVQAAVEGFHRKFGIAPRANDLRYISPAPLGVYLALDAVQSYPELVRTLRQALPGEPARRAYDERIAAILANPRAKAFGEEELARFFHWSHFLDATAVERWVTMSAANPVLAAGKAREALQGASDEERERIANGARRGLVRGLIRLASHADAFHDAALALAELAAAENETWANNASGEFVSRFQIVLGGTACPYGDRLAVLDEMLTSGRVQLQALAIRALAQAGIEHEMNIVDSPPAPGPRPLQWQPASDRDYFDCALPALQRLERAAELPIPDQVLVAITKALAMRLRDQPVRESIAAFLRATARHHPGIREEVRREVHDVARATAQDWKDRSSADVAWLEALEAEFSDHTLQGRLRERVGHPDWQRTEDSLRSLAEDLVEHPELLWAELPWLTGGNAAGAWDLGVALEKADSRHDLLSKLVTAAKTGSDLRLIVGYVGSLARAMPDGWADDWVDEVEKQPTSTAQLIFELTWRLAGTSRGAQRLSRMARANQLPATAIAHLAFGPWVLGPELPALRELLCTLIVDPGNRIHLLHMVGNRVKKHPQDAHGLEEIALALVADPELLLADKMSQYQWDKLASTLVPHHSHTIARTIFAAQARPNRAQFFLRNSLAMNTLNTCIEVDAAAVWDELAPYLEGDQQGERFAIGFPDHVMGAMPRESVLAWIAVAPKTRAVRVARMSAKNFLDTSLAAAILDQWSNIDRVKQQFFSAFVRGGWSGNASDHWEQLAGDLEHVARESKLPGVRRWAIDGVHELHRMAADDRKREVEQRIRGYG